jgi:hypothetical protein
VEENITIQFDRVPLKTRLNAAENVAIFTTKTPRSDADHKWPYLEDKRKPCHLLRVKRCRKQRPERRQRHALNPFNLSLILHSMRRNLSEAAET